MNILIYCLDTSAILDGWVRYYPPDIFLALWDNLDEMISEGTLISPDEVRDELSKKEDSAYEWAMKRDELFQPLDEPTQTATSEILAKFPELVKAIKDRNRADPFVIALAKVRNATVVTGERNPGTPERPRIPLVCKHFNVSYLNLLEMIRAMGWTFR